MTAQDRKFPYTTVGNGHPPLYGGLIPAPYTDPQCYTCKGTGVTGPYGTPTFKALAPADQRGQTSVWWEPCRPCSVPRLLGQQFTKPGRGMTITIVEELRRGPAYGPDRHTHTRVIHLYVHNGDHWLSESEAPTAIIYADWGRGPAGHVVGEIWPGAATTDSNRAPDHKATVMHEITLTAGCSEEGCT